MRDDGDIPSKKRQARRKKLALIDTLKQRLKAQLADPAGIAMEQVEPA